MVSKKPQPSIVDDVLAFQQLEQRMHDRLAGKVTPRESWISRQLNRTIDIWTLGFAVIGVLVTVICAGLALYPLAAVSWAYWFA